MAYVTAFVVGYWIGSVPFAFLVARFRGIDLRNAGSGNVGAANVFRTTGAVSGAVALGLDLAKGAASVAVVARLSPESSAHIVAGLGAIVGHTYPMWLSFKGGKGVATSAGVFAVLFPLGTAIAAGTFTVVVAISRYVSLGSLAGALALMTMALVTDVPWSVRAAALAAGVVVTLRHRDNMARLIAGAERRLEWPR